MSSTCFDTEGSSSGKVCIYRYGIVFYVHQYKQSCG